MLRLLGLGSPIAFSGIELKCWPGSGAIDRPVLILLKKAGQMFKVGECWIEVDNDQSHQLREYREKKKVCSFCFKINELSYKKNYLIKSFPIKTIV